MLTFDPGREVLGAGFICHRGVGKEGKRRFGTRSCEAVLISSLDVEVIYLVVGHSIENDDDVNRSSEKEV